MKNLEEKATSLLKEMCPEVEALWLAIASRVVVTDGVASFSYIVNAWCKKEDAQDRLFSFRLYSPSHEAPDDTAERIAQVAKAHFDETPRNPRVVTWTSHISDGSARLCAAWGDKSFDVNYRALALLQETLPDLERVRYTETGCIECVGNVTGQRYRIHRADQVNIQLVGDRKVDGAGCWGCVVFLDNLPIEDLLLAQYLMITTNESCFLEKVKWWN